MGLKQQPKCKDKTCQFCTGKYCTILKQKPDVCKFYKAMIEKEAINVMTQAREDAGQAFLGKVQFNVPQYHAVIKALEKQIPKKAGSIYKGDYKCPTCENYIDITDDDLYIYEIEPPKYCDECGQALDWGEEE